MAKRILLLHFNDVYNIESVSKQPVGGAARMATLVKNYQKRQPLVLFSGDCLSPSIMSTVFRGKQMVPVLNAIGVHAACLGNHDLDFGIDYFRSLKKEWNFPWLAANVIDKRTGRRLGDVKDVLMVERAGVKIAIIGLVEADWLMTLWRESPDDIEYRDFVQIGRELARKCIANGAEIVMALTHMRQTNDVLLLDSVPEIDIVLGGHDHEYHTALMEKNRNLLVKSGTDFQELTKIEVEIKSSGKKVYEWERLVVDHGVREDPNVGAIVSRFSTLMGASLDRFLGYTAVDLDGRYSSVRTRETNLCNFVCDVVREATETEVCLINSGTFRSNRFHPRGCLTKRDLLSTIPLMDDLVVLQITGRQLLAALENGVSKFPSLEGRFPQVSGLRFAFDPKKLSGNRIVPGSVFLPGRNEILDKERLYTVCTKDYLFKGRDGYDVLTNALVCKDSEATPNLPTLLRHHFMKLEVLTVWKRSLIEDREISVRKYLAKLKRRTVHSPPPPAASSTAVFDETLQAYAIQPVIEGRIIEI